MLAKGYKTVPTATTGASELHMYYLNILVNKKYYICLGSICIQNNTLYLKILRNLLREIERLAR